MTFTIQPTYLPRSVVEKIGIREWGLPMGMYVGSLWRTHCNPADPALRVVVILPHPHRVERMNPNLRSIEPRPVVFANQPLLSRPLHVPQVPPPHPWIPRSWAAALVRYARDWPESARAQIAVLRSVDPYLDRASARTKKCIEEREARDAAAQAEWDAEEAAQATPERGNA